MAPSKLELCATILQILNEKGPAGFAKIAFSIKKRSNVLVECISLLAKEGVVNQTRKGNLVVYDITPNGKKVLSFFKLDDAIAITRVLRIARPLGSKKVEGKNKPLH
jgi:predicted transcriptional regulator